MTKKNHTKLITLALTKITSLNLLYTVHLKMEVCLVMSLGIVFSVLGKMQFSHI